MVTCQLLLGWLPSPVVVCFAADSESMLGRPSEFSERSRPRYAPALFLSSILSLPLPQQARYTRVPNVYLPLKLGEEAESYGNGASL